MLHAGRGIPNWLAVPPRQAWLTLGRFALEESTRRGGLAADAGAHAQPDGIADRFGAFADAHPGESGLDLLRAAVSHGVDALGFEPDGWVYELASGLLGDFYPHPDRMLAHCEQVVHAYFQATLCAGNPPPGRYDIFATEGGAAGIGYCFESLKQNRLLNPGDRIALGAPIFSPYLEIPRLQQFGLDVLELDADPARDWQYPDSEIEKLRDPSVKAFFLVNPGNPTTRAMHQESTALLADVVASGNPDLIVLTDDVYATFLDSFRSLAADLPANTLCVYSFSKHFGATGLRLGFVALHEDNRIDGLLAEQSDDDRRALAERYRSVTDDPSSLGFIDRIVADSRSVGLYHVSGLSTPMQVLMTLFALYFLLDDGAPYRNATKELVNARLHDLFGPLGLPVPATGDNNTHYYVLVDILDLAARRHGDDFASWLRDRYHPLTFVAALAEEKSIVVLPGAGFDAPNWTVRVSLANLDDRDYVSIGHALTEIVDEAHEAFTG